jgi:hypothetical protein
MATFDVALNPYDVTARAPHLQNNNIMGWIPGEIMEIADSGKIGRIKVSSALLQPNHTMPNGWDGYALVLEDFVANNSKGGSHKFLQRGSQVAMIPMMGDPTQLLVIGCIPSLTDRPSPELDRSKGLYGQHTPGQIFKINNDNDGSSIDARPSGAVQHVSGKGDLSAQTKNGARYNLQADGTVQIQNDLASTTLTPEGSVETKNKQEGSFLLKTDGTVELKSSSEATLKLIEGKAELTGPLHPISSSVKELGQKLPAVMTTVRDTLGKITKAMDSFKSGGDLNALIAQVQPLLGSFNEIKGTLESVTGSIEQLSKVNVKDLAGLLMPQVEQFLGSEVSRAIPQVTKIVENLENNSGEALVGELLKALPPSLTKSINPAILTPILDALQHNKPMQTQQLLETLIPGGLTSIGGISGLGLEKVLNTIHGTFSDIPAKPTLPQIGGQIDTSTETMLELERNLNSWQQQVDEKETVLNGLLPETIRQHVSGTDLKGLINSIATNEGTPMQAIEALIGKASSGAIGNLIPHAQEALKITDTVPLINDLLGALNGKGDLSSLVPSLLKNIPGMPQLDTNDLLGSAIKTALPLAMNYFTGGMGGSLGSLVGGFNGISGLLGKGNKGGILRVTQNMVEAKANENGTSASLKVTEPQAALVGIGGLTQVFAGQGSAGVKTPWGSFGLGSGGADFLSQAKMAFQVAQGVGKAAGFVLDPKLGASLASFEDKDLKQKTAEMTVDDGHVIINSLRDPSDVPGIKVSPSGTFIEGLRVPEIWDFLKVLNGRFSPIESVVKVGEQGTSVDDVLIGKLNQQMSGAEQAIGQLDQRLVSLDQRVVTAEATLAEVAAWYHDWLSTAQLPAPPAPPPTEV